MRIVFVMKSGRRVMVESHFIEVEKHSRGLAISVAEMPDDFEHDDVRFIEIEPSHPYIEVEKYIEERRESIKKGARRAGKPR